MPVLGRKANLREERRAATERQIAAATRELLDDGESFADLSIDMIAARAGISRTAFYDYFRDKRELLIRLVGEAMEPIMREADELVGGRPSGPTEIPHTIAAAVAFARGSPQVFRAAVEAAGYDPVISSFWREQLLERFIDVIEERIRKQRKAGIALPIHPRAAAVALVMMVVETLYHHVSSDEGLTDDQVLETLVTISVRAVYGPVDELASGKKRAARRG
jgi:AcrR family transcriptional regulator